MHINFKANLKNFTLMELHMERAAFKTSAYKGAVHQQSCTSSEVHIERTAHRASCTSTEF